MQKATQLHPIIKELLEKRGFGENLEDFFSTDLNKLPNLLDLKDLDIACKKITEHILNNQKIGIYGDYDVDGTTSCALFHHFFKLIGFDNFELIQPSRFIEGYGLHPSSIEKAFESDIKLLITVDCGITNVEAAAYAKEKGIDLIITDHHKDACEKMPDAFAIVNPNRRDEESSERAYLAGVGVAFAVCWAVKNELLKQGRETPSIYPLLQFVAIGTICDLAKLSPMNIKLVRHGLRQIPSTQFPGIRAFLSKEERELESLPSEKLSFYIGPMINSKGRLDHPEIALKLLISSSSEEAYPYYSQLEISNNERKVIQNEVFHEAKELVSKEVSHSTLYSAIAYQAHWHEGVIGIVASKLVDYFKVPSIVLTNSEEEGIIKASARSAGELNIFNCLKECEDLFLKFGGHKAAAGFSLPEENFDLFKKRFNEVLSQYSEIERTEKDSYDIEVNETSLTPIVAKQIENLEPFGMGNPKPIFKIKGLEIAQFDILKGSHVRWTFKSENLPHPLKGISFNYIGKLGNIHPDELFQMQKERNNQLTAFFSLDINRFRGNEYLQLGIKNINFDL